MTWRGRGVDSHKDVKEQPAPRRFVGMGSDEIGKGRGLFRYFLNQVAWETLRDDWG